MQATASDLHLDPAVLAELVACEGATFVRRAYWVLLGREPDPRGLDDYVARLEAGTSKQQVLLELFESPEGREKDIAGMAATTPAALSGSVAPATPQALRNLWTASSWDELLANHGRAFLSCAYQTLLGRDADPDGVRYYEARLRAGAAKVQVLSALRLSTEYRTRRRLLRELHGALPGSPRSGSDGAPARARVPPGVSPSGRTPTLTEALALDDAGLVSCLCSLALGAGRAESQLQRDALEHLHGGAAPRLVLQIIEKSVPGRARRALLRRLDREIIKSFLARTPVLGRLAAAMLGIDGDSPVERRLRRIEYQVLGSSEEVNRAAELRADLSATHEAAEAAPAASAESARRSGQRESRAPAAVSALRSLPTPTDWGDK